MTVPQLKPAAVRLLEAIAEHDRGEGVLFERAERGRWQAVNGIYSVNHETFRVPSARALITVAHPQVGVWQVRLTEAGRAHLAERENRRTGKSVET